MDSNTILIFAIIVIFSLLLMVFAYARFLRKLPPTLGYLLSVSMIIFAVIVNGLAFYFLNKGNRQSSSTMSVAGVKCGGDHCTKETFQNGLNQLSKATDDKRRGIQAELLLSCMDNRSQSIVIKEIAQDADEENQGIMHTSKAPFDQYVEALQVLHLGDTIIVDEVKSNEQGCIIYLEITEKHAKNN